MSAAPSIKWDRDTMEFATILGLASPGLRREIIAELYRACERAEMPPRREARS